MSLNCRTWLYACVLILFNSSVLAATVRDNPEKIQLNDMRTGAGKLANGVLTLHLDAREGGWYPDGPEGMMRPVAAFAEAGKPLQNPGPLVRAPLGTEIHITIRNSLAEPLWLFGLGAQRGMAADSFVVEPGGTREVRFKPAEAGVFWYAGKTSKAPLFGRDLADSQLNGALVIDPPGQAIRDRLFVISWWGEVDTTKVSGLSDGTAIVINGAAWPNTERVQATQGDTLQFRWIGMTAVPHPMHLHGFYFHIDGKGDGKSYTEFAPEARQQAVTELVEAGHVVSATWVPERPGNWIFHCHFAGHMTSLEGLNQDRRHPDTRGAQKASHDHGKHYMYGLVLGIEVKPKGEMKATTAAARPIRLLIRSKPEVYGEFSGYAYVLGGSGEENDANALPLPGPTLVLKKDEPVAITIVNHTHEHAAVHWHGIELESFPDGVPGWSGWKDQLLPAIAPGDSFTVRFTPPRAGTFMYHSHSNELQQIGSGLYGAIVVLEPGQKYEPETDRILMLSDDGPITNVIRGPFPKTMLNGKANPAPIALDAGKRYRFRVINIRAEFPGMLALLDGERPVEWKMIARVGADLPASQVKAVPVMLVSAPGQIWDFEYTPEKAGELKLRFGYPPFMPEESFGKPTEIAVTVR